MSVVYIGSTILFLFVSFCFLYHLDLQGGNKCHQHCWKQSSGILTRCVLIQPQRTGCFGSNSQWSTLFWNPIRSDPCCFEFHSQHVVCVVNQQKQSIYLKFADDISHLQTYTLTISKMLLLFSQLSVVIRLDKVSEINYALLKAPEFTSTYVETQHKVTCMLKTT